MSLTLYGTAASRTFRCLWMLAEADLEYDLVEVDFRDGGTRQRDFLMLNPNGHIPVLVDGELVIWESFAINMHLARRYANDMWPEDADTESELHMWNAWALCEIEGPHDAANRTDGALEEDQLLQNVAALSARLGGRDYLLGDSFTVADLNVASVLMRPRISSGVLRRHDNVYDWFQRCRRRPALAAIG